VGVSGLVAVFGCRREVAGGRGPQPVGVACQPRRIKAQRAFAGGEFFPPHTAQVGPRGGGWLLVGSSSGVGFGVARHVTLTGIFPCPGCRLAGPWARGCMSYCIE